MSKIKRVNEIGINQHPNASVYSLLYLQLSSTVLHLQAAVYGRFVFLQLQLRLLHCVVQLHVISSMTDSGVDGRDEKLVQVHHFQFSIPLSLLEVVQDAVYQLVGLSTLMLGSVPAWRERIGHRALGVASSSNGWPWAKRLDRALSAETVVDLAYEVLCISRCVVTENTFAERWQKVVLFYEDVLTRFLGVTSQERQ